MSGDSSGGSGDRRSGSRQSSADGSSQGRRQGSRNQEVQGPQRQDRRQQGGQAQGRQQGGQAQGRQQQGQQSGDPAQGPPGGGPPGGDPDDSGGRGGGDPMEGSTVWKWARRVLIAVVLLIGLVVLLFATGVLGVPSAGVSDVGDWGEVTDERTEIVTTVWVDNPNPVGLSLGDSVTVDYDVFMNDVQMAEGSRSDISVSPGNNTQVVRTDLRNDRLNEWWAGFIEANETIDMAITTEITVDAILSGSFDATMEQRLLEEETPVIDALSGSVNSTSGEYTATADGGSLNESALRDTGLGAVGDRSVTVGYEVERGWATWESANESTTTVLLHMDVHNPGDVPVPAAPDGIGFTTEANDVTMFEGETEDMSLRSVGPDATIAPGETREVTVAVDMDNDNIDDWFTSHVRNGEVSQLSTQFQVVFEEPISGETFRIPGESDATYDCEFRTAMLVDDQASGTTCGEGPAG